MKPTECSKCEELFYDSIGLQLKVQDIAYNEGPLAASEYINELFEEEHREHEDGD